MAQSCGYASWQRKKNFSVNLLITPMIGPGYAEFIDDSGAGDHHSDR
jgi:hypothetical protein